MTRKKHLNAIFGLFGYSIMLWIGGTVFTMKNVDQTVSSIGMICFLGWIPVLLITIRYILKEREISNYWLLLAFITPFLTYSIFKLFA